MTSLVITFHWKSSANPRWNYTGNGRILRGSAAIRGGIKIFRGGIISGQVSGIAGGSEKSSAGVGGLVKIPLDCTVYPLNSTFIIIIKLGLRGVYEFCFFDPKHALWVSLELVPTMNVLSENIKKKSKYVQ